MTAEGREPAALFPRPGASSDVPFEMVGYGIFDPGYPVVGRSIPCSEIKAILQDDQFNSRWVELAQIGT
jgi:hypothetical protein